jgi:hypothetical protein
MRLLARFLVPALFAATSASLLAGAEIPAGSSLIVRTTRAIDSEGAELGTEYPAGIDQEIAVNGVTLPRGTDAVLRIEQTEQAGRFRGKASLTLRLVAIVIGGQRIAVDTNEVTAASEGKGEKVTGAGAVGAAAGAILGGAFGGGKGAAIGAGVGGAAGVAATALKGQRIKVPAESRLTFKTAKPIVLP